MADSFLLRIDVTQLRQRLSTLQHRALTNGDVFQWLLEKGFTIRAAGWCATSAEIILRERIG